MVGAQPEGGVVGGQRLLTLGDEGDVGGGGRCVPLGDQVDGEVLGPLDAEAVGGPELSTIPNPNGAKAAS